MKSIFKCFLWLVFLAPLAGNAQQEGIGLGITVGQPTGISIKEFLTKEQAYQASVAWSFTTDGNRSFQSGYIEINGDYLWHSYEIFQVPHGNFPVYAGLGARYISKSYPSLGVRMPLGLSYIFQDAPMDIFAELVPIMNLMPATTFEIAGGVGFRIYL